MVILAFPGMGKTPLAKRNPKYLDLDFGFFRTAHGVAKEDEERLLVPFAKLVKLYESEGYVVLTNDPKLMKHLKVSRVLLPENHLYSARKLGVSVSKVTEWVAGWRESAKASNIPVTYVKGGLEYYLK